MFTINNKHIAIPILVNIHSKFYSFKYTYLKLQIATIYHIKLAS